MHEVFSTFFFSVFDTNYAYCTYKGVTRINSCLNIISSFFFPLHFKVLLFLPSNQFLLYDTTFDQFITISTKCIFWLYFVWIFHMIASKMFVQRLKSLDWTKTFSNSLDYFLTFSMFFRFFSFFILVYFWVLNLCLIFPPFFVIICIFRHFFFSMDFSKWKSIEFEFKTKSGRLKTLTSW